ncbi:MAG TPA: hypothetical protein VFT53_00970 [Candidatus Saccharimonadales bacterium]|nr:hypothetical protein [Candidatus Saccharimonadales bacterium]
MNSNAESLLVVISLLFGISLFVVRTFKGPRVSILKNNTYIDVAKLPLLLKLLGAIALVSLPMGFLIGRNITLTLQFAGLNLLFGIIMGAGFTLLSERPQDTRKHNTERKT